MNIPALAVSLAAITPIFIVPDKQLFNVAPSFALLISLAATLALHELLHSIGLRFCFRMWVSTHPTFLLQSNVDLNMIRSWLGHASIETTHGYVEIDLEMKRKTLRSCKKLLPSKPSRSGNAITTSSPGSPGCSYVQLTDRAKGLSRFGIAADARRRPSAAG